MLDALAALAKALLYAGLLSSAGAVLAQATLRRAADLEHIATAVVRRGALLTIVSAIVLAALLLVRLGGAFDEVTLSAVFLSSSGAALLLQLAGASLLLVNTADGSAQVTRIGNAAIATLSFAFNGHAAAVGFTEGLVAFLHASAAAWWIGALWLLRHATAQLPVDNAAVLVRRFSAVAMGIVAGLVLVGVVLILVLVDFARLAEIAGYVRMLALKVALALVVLGLAIYNKLRLTPRLGAGDASAAFALHRTIGVELAVIGAVLLTTAILTTYTSPHEDAGDL